MVKLSTMEGIGLYQNQNSVLRVAHQCYIPARIAIPYGGAREIAVIHVENCISNPAEGDGLSSPQLLPTLSTVFGGLVVPLLPAFANVMQSFGFEHRKDNIALLVSD